MLTFLYLDDCRLVVLSGCDTGVTAFRTGEDELIGMPLGLLEVGAPGVVTTLWKIDDKATSCLIERSYLIHLKDRLPPPQALQQAQAFLRDATWAGLGRPNRNPQNGHLPTVLLGRHRPHWELALKGYRYALD